MKVGQIGKQAVYATPNGIKLGGSGRVVSAREFYSKIPKNERRKIRKACRAAGYLKHAEA